MDPTTHFLAALVATLAGRRLGVWLGARPRRWGFRGHY